MHERRRPPPNDLFRRARERLPSPSGAPRPASRTELAEAVNAYLWHTHGIRENLNEHDIGRIERGETRWPGKQRRTRLRAVLGATSDADIGLYTHGGAPAVPLDAPAVSGEAEDVRRSEFLKRTGAALASVLAPPLVNG